MTQCFLYLLYLRFSCNVNLSVQFASEKRQLKLLTIIGDLLIGSLHALDLSLPRYYNQ